MTEDRMTKHYVITRTGIKCILIMRQSAFMAESAANFAIQQDHSCMSHDSAVFWYEYACNNGIVFC